MPLDEPARDEELETRLHLAELEHRCVEIGRYVDQAMQNAGAGGIDPSTFVVTELVIAALARDRDPLDIVEWFDSQGFIRSASRALGDAVR